MREPYQVPTVRTCGAAAQVGQAAWFFGNLYEAMVDVPQLLLDAQPRRRPGLISAGSPLRYYAPLGPPTVAATAAALIGSWRSGGDRRLIAAAGVNTAVAMALTAYLVRRVNVRLLSGGTSGDAAEQRRMMRVWHRANGVRLIATAGAWIALRRAYARDGQSRARRAGWT